jgi:hypothetical protein
MMPSPSQPLSRRGQGGFSGIGRSTPMLVEMVGLATAGCREPASSARLPVHRSESPTGYSSAGCSPAEPASASPVSDNSSSIPIRRGNQMRCSTSLQGCSSGPCPAFGCGAVSRSWCPPPTGVSSLLCAPGVISILRRHCGKSGGVFAWAQNFPATPSRFLRRAGS